MTDTDDWRAHAACAAHRSPDWWFSYDVSLQEAALEVCARCPVRVECLQYALERREQHGIWGGRTQDQLRDIRRDIRRRLSRHERHQE